MKQNVGKYFIHGCYAYIVISFNFCRFDFLPSNPELILKDEDTRGVGRFGREVHLVSDSQHQDDSLFFL